MSDNRAGRRYLPRIRQHPRVKIDRCGGNERAVLSPSCTGLKSPLPSFFLFKQTINGSQISARNISPGTKGHPRVPCDTAGQRLSELSLRRVGKSERRRKNTGRKKEGGILVDGPKQNHTLKDTLKRTEITTAAYEKSTKRASPSTSQQSSLRINGSGRSGPYVCLSVYPSVGPSRVTVPAL